MEHQYQFWIIIHRHRIKRQGITEVLVYEAVLYGVNIEQWILCVDRKKKGDEIHGGGELLARFWIWTMKKLPLADTELGSFNPYRKVVPTAVSS